ncbi:MAG: EamA family transporter [Ruminiclostridium sp.]|nr:EamA family transporter [Ruminiclostridium sp.]
MNIKKNSGPFYVFLAAFLWSFAGVCSKFIPWGALSIACIRGLIAAVTIGVANRKFIFKPTPAILLGAFGTFITSVLFMFANKITTAANAIVIQYTAPVFVMILSAVFLKVKAKKLDIIIVFITLIGISVFFVDHLGQGAILGDLLALLSGISFSLVFFANKMPGANPMSASYLGCLLHGLLIPFLFFDENLRNFDLSITLIVIFNGVVQLGMAYIFFSKGIKSTSAISASIIAMIEPILNPIWVFLLINERPSPLSIIGAIIVIAAVGVYNTINSQKTKAS